MDTELIHRFRLLNTYSARVEEELEPVRAELVAWWRSFIQKRKPPQNARHIRATTQTNDGIAFQLTCHWGPHPTRPITFTPTLTGATFREQELVALGLDLSYLRHIAPLTFFNIIASAWVEAGGLTYTHSLTLDGSKIEDANPQRVWVDHENPIDDPKRPCMWLEYAQQYIRSAIGIVSTHHTPKFRYPVTRGTTAPSPATLTALQSGANNALTAWANELTEASDTATATVLRNFDELANRLMAEVRAVAPEAGFKLYSDGTLYGWVIGDCDSETDNAETRLVAKILSRWNDLHPAVEWLFRYYGLHNATVDSVDTKSVSRAQPVVCNLAGDEHFTPFDTTVAVTRVAYLPADAGE